MLLLLAKEASGRFFLFPVAVVGGIGCHRLVDVTTMEIDTLLEAFTDFEKKGKKDACPALDQLLSHVAKTGETMISWSQFKSYFLFKLEKVMDDFRTSTPDQRGPANPNVEYIPFEEMKERILKIVDGYNGIPFTIQRLCELLTEPKRNYTGTDKFLRGVEKNVMVVSCVYPTSENINGPGTPRPLNRPKLLLSTSLATNGLPDSTDDKEPLTEQEEEHVVSDSSVSESDATKTSLMKTKHPEEDATEAEIHSVKRLKFEKDMDEDEMSGPAPAQSSADMPESSTDIVEEEKDKSADMLTTDDHEPSSTQTEEPFDEEETAETSEREAESGPTNSLKSDSTMDQSEEQLDQSGKDLSLEEQGEGDCSDPVSSSSSNGEGAPSEEPVPSASPSSKAESLAEGAAAENSSESPETADEPMEQD
ncbi:serine/threonine-protein phosphatase 4 regulatory subunit 2-A-like isoform X2 [Coregonus clupeaformis]|uniref:serine/threonine-protein phosphatase 4 regulatory subunit 2-A-like isoform X2 n=1 Tax=Coregonus clupeaformis TaxID=59861 RepID=UPI001BDFC7A7|nr:serine/threonine-protein phosphatase 4 regulatory subunit 2-A-like isoform X2 [Coregonus clupeaformis]